MPGLNRFANTKHFKATWIRRPFSIDSQHSVQRMFVVYCRQMQKKRSLFWAVGLVHCCSTHCLGFYSLLSPLVSIVMANNILRLNDSNIINHFLSLMPRAITICRDIESIFIGLFILRRFVSLSKMCWWIENMRSFPSRALCPMHFTSVKSKTRWREKTLIRVTRMVESIKFINIMKVFNLGSFAPIFFFVRRCFRFFSFQSLIALLLIRPCYLMERACAGRTKNGK